MTTVLTIYHNHKHTVLKTKQLFSIAAFVEERLSGWMVGSEVFSACGVQQSIQWLKLRCYELHKSWLKNIALELKVRNALNSMRRI